MFELKNLNFVECGVCRAKPGTPILCDSCLNNRHVIFELKAMLKTSNNETERFHEVARRNATRRLLG